MQHEKLRLTEVDAEIADIAMYQKMMIPLTVFFLNKKIKKSTVRRND